MEFTPKKQPNFGSGPLRHNPYSTGGRTYIKRYKKRTGNGSTPRSSLVTPPRTSLQKRFLSRTDKIVNISSKPQTQHGDGQTLGKWLSKKGTPQAIKRPFSAINGKENLDDPYRVFTDSDSEVSEIGSKTNNPLDSSNTLSDSDCEIFDRKNKTSGKENLFFGPHKNSSVKVYTKKKSLNLSKSRLVSDISPEKVERAYGSKLSSEAEKENIPTDIKGELAEEITSPHLIGFPNYGNTCYLNSVIQSLFGLPAFLGDYKVVASQLSMPHTSLSFGLSQVLSNRMKGQVSGVKQSLKTIKENLERVDGSFSGFKMQDANEFLTRVLDTIKDEIDRCHMTTPSPDRPVSSRALVNTAKIDVDEDICLSGAPMNVLSLSSSPEPSKGADGDIGDDITDNEVINVPETNVRYMNEKDITGIKVIDAEVENSKCKSTYSYTNGKKLVGREIAVDPRCTVNAQEVTPRKTCEEEIMPRNPVKDNFEFQLLESYRCLGCNEVEGRRQEYFGLYVNLPEGQDSIQDAISSYMGADERELKCEKCGHNQSSVVTSVTRLPRILIIQLKRYEYKPEQHESVKMSSRVRINRWLSLNSYLTSDGCGPSHWSPQTGSYVTPRTPKQATLTVRNLSSELNMCDGKKDEEELPCFLSPAKPSGSFTATTSDKEDEELQEVMRRSMDDVGGVREEDEIQQAIRLSLQELGMSYTQENQGENAEGKDDEKGQNSLVIEENGESDRHTYCLISVISHFGLTTNTGHYVADVFNCEEDSWFHYDDECVVKIPETVVFAEGRQKNGYIFFYMHKDLFKKMEKKTSVNR
ncbi:ubiquitin carboxyl-terminal hydrolase 37-like [Homarus americanus]|uniref:ubiquitin carboxyl-terminal hydrolase 37-like n=1 Tax=Homarus americanus TaxID=6706 RepID=UPI001C48E42F|nr:ubiquitin carboxyl-terminal hydrolase 37-like [Homarus americanus]